MVRRTVSSTIFILSLALLGGQPAQANTPLTRAVVSSLRNQVRLLPSRKPARKARVSDVLSPGDGIVTSRRSLAELRFNDGSLARMGEQAVFRFIPKTRSFRLSNGTVLMLIPPGQGRTQVRTPNVTAGIRGSALMIRYDKVTNTSTVIALTNSEISVTNNDGTQTQVLAAGQAVVTVGDEIVDSYDVDLQELYRTSQLLKDLEMNNPNAEVKDEAIAQVRQETLEGIQSQRSFVLGEGRDLTEDFRLSELNIDSVIADETGRPFGTALPGVAAEYTSFPGRSIGVDGRFNEDDSVTVPTGNQPADLDPPVATTIDEPQGIDEQAPIVEPPVIVDPPVAVEPPAVEPPIVAPPFMEDPVSEKPVDAVDDFPGGGEIADDVTAPDDTPIAEVDSLPEDIPIFGGDMGALNPSTPGDDGGDHLLPGGDSIVGDVTVPDDAPISEADSLPQEIPIFGGDMGALNPSMPGDDGGELPDTEIVVDNHPMDTEMPTEVESPMVVDDIANIDVPSGSETPGLDTDLDPTGDLGITITVTIDVDQQEIEPESETPELDILDPTRDLGITVTVTVEGDQEEIEQLLMSPDTADTTVEPSQTEDWGS